MARFVVGKNIFIMVFCCLLAIFCLVLIVGNVWRVFFNDYFYCIIFCMGCLIVVVLVFIRNKFLTNLIFFIFVMTIFWAVWWSVLNYWVLFPHLLVLAGFVILSLLLLHSYIDNAKSIKWVYLGASVLGIAFASFFIGAFLPYDVITLSDGSTFIESKRVNTPSDRFTCGRNTEGSCHAPFTQINSTNVRSLRLAWVSRNSDFEQNTPLAIDGIAYNYASNGLKCQELGKDRRGEDIDELKPRFYFLASAPTVAWDSATYVLSKCRLKLYKSTAQHPHE